MSDDTTTSERFHPVTLTIIDATSSPVETHAKKTPPPESTEGALNRHSAVSSSGLLRRFALVLFSGRIPRNPAPMLPGLGGDSDPSWSALVTLCCPSDSGPVALGHPTGGTDCSCLAILPTPTANLFPVKDVEKLLDRREREVAKGRNGNGFGLTLAQWVAINENQHARPIGPVAPDWIEWLMGFPIGWTELGPSETPSCPKSPNGSAGECSNP